MHNPMKAPAAQVECAKKAAAMAAANKAKSKPNVFDRVAARQAQRPRARRIARGKMSRADGDGDGDGDGDADDDANGGAIRLISKPEVLDRVGVTFPTIWKWMREGKFPRSRELGGKAAWIEAEVEAWIANLPVRRLKGDGEAAR